MNKRYLTFLVAVTLLAGSCMVGSKYTRPNIAVPEDFGIQSNTDSLPLVKWFELYKDTALQSIIKTTLDNNKNLLVASNRIQQAQIQTEIIRLNQYPTLGYQVQAGGGTAGISALKVGAGLNSALFSTMGLLSWEVDIWGKLRRVTAAAQQQLLASQDNRDALKVSLVAQAASLYFFLRDLDNRLQIAEKTLQLRKESTQIISERFEKGYIAELDKLQAIQQEAIAASFVPNLKRQIVQTENALNVLMGKTSGPVNRGIALFDEVLPPEIPSGLPSQLLARRPDLKSAEHLLRAQFESIGIAQASLYPSFSLTGLLGFASPQVSSILTNGFVANGLGGLTGPLFQFGQNKKRIELVKQQTMEIQIQYEQALLNALGDVNNALVGSRTFNEEYEKRKEQVDAARKALVLSNARYDYGYTSYLEVLTQENSLFDAELLESQLYQQRLNSIVLLYQALGGGWNP